MENYVGIKVKRKELEDINNDDFFDFSLLSPARKMRRLNAEMPPIIEEEEPDMHTWYEQWVPENSVSNDLLDPLKPPIIEELPSVPENEEKAIVLFNPMNNPTLYSQGKLSVDPNLISCFKNQTFWGNQLNYGKSKEDDEAMESGNNDEENACRAVVLWVPSSKLNPGYETQASEAMDAEEMEASTMEIEDSDATNVGDSNFSRLNEGMQHQWFQQHCMVPQPPENITTPIVWYR